MRFDYAITTVAGEISKSDADNETLLKIKNAINFAKIEVGKAAYWNQLIVSNAEIVTTPKYETGVASVSSGSRTVTLVGGTVSSGFVGRFFKTLKAGAEYEIISVDTSTNQLTLSSPYIEESDSAATYYIKKIFYRVNSDILCVLPDMNRDDREPSIDLEGYDLYVTDYQTGTISVAANSQTVTGSGTSFLDNVYPGDVLEAGSNSYRVLRVNSDTSLTLVNRAISEFDGEYVVSHETPYKAKLANLSYWDNQTSQTLLRYRYIRNLYPMVNDADTTELPTQFDRCILDFAKAEFGRTVNNPGLASDYQVAQLRLDKLKLDRNLVYHAFNSFQQIIPATSSGRYNRYGY